MPWLVALSVAQAGIMWWRWPWAVGALAGFCAFGIWFYSFSASLILFVAAGFVIQGALPALVFHVRRLPYDMSREIALNTFFLTGVIGNTLFSTVCVILAGLWQGIVEQPTLFATTALVWLVHSVGTLIISLPLLRLGTHVLPLHGPFGTTAALQRGIHPPSIVRSDIALLAAILATVAAISWGINQITYVPAQFMNVLFLLPIVVLTVLRGFDGALLAATGSIVIALGFVLEPASRLGDLPPLNNERITFASIVFELGVYYLISMVCGLLLDTQRAERKRLTVLLDLSRLLNANQEAPALVAAVADHIGDAIEASACVITLYDAARERLVPLAWTTGAAIPASVLQPAPLANHPAFAAALTTNQARVHHCNDPQPHPSISAFWVETGYITAALVPLYGARGVIGLVQVFDTRPERIFTKAEVELAEAMCSQAAAAFEQRRLIGDLRDQAEHLSAVSNITAVLNATLNLDVVCRRIDYEIARVVPHDWACVALTSGDTPGYEIIMAYGDVQVRLGDGERVTLSDEMAAGLGDVDGPARFDLRRMPDALNVPLLEAGLITMLVVPLRRDDRWLGLLLLASRDSEAFPETQRQLLQMLARHMALAISNAQLYDELEKTYRAKQEAQDVLLQTERFRALGELSSGIAHDFNNLLAGILGHTQLLLLDAGADNREGLMVIEQAARDGTHMVQRIQQFSRSQRPKQHETIDINEIVDDVIQLTRPRWHNRSAETAIEARVQPGVVPLIQGSAHALREVLTNLVLNAIDAMPSGGRLTVRTAAEADGVRIEVADTGVGMSEQTQAQMWEPFFSTKGERGTGLGLTMTHAIIVQQHGGRINVQSAEHAGTTFTLILPLHQTEKQPDEVPPIEASNEAPGRMLIVESDPRVQSALGRLLESRGHAVVSTDSGHAALALASRERFDMLIVDSGLIDISAWDLAARLKEQMPHLLAVLLTVWSTSDVDQRRQVFDALLPKPFESDVVQTVIAELLATRSTVGQA